MENVGWLELFGWMQLVTRHEGLVIEIEDWALCLQIPLSELDFQSVESA